MPENKRILALDVMRGLVIAMMIMCNMPGSWSAVNPYFEHSEWFGLTPPDFVFPFFLFMVGCSMSFGFEKFFKISRAQAILKLAKRASLLILIGFLIHAFPFYNAPASEWRIPGVLQRIGVCYFLAGVLILYFRNLALFIWSVAILVLYYDLLQLSLTPYALGSNFVGWLDTQILGTSHLWDKDHSFDPEGILSSLPAVVNVLLGYFAGKVLLRVGTLDTQLNSLAAYGAMTLLLGLLTAVFVPISKNLWTPSFVLITSGAAYLFLFFLIWCIDVKKSQFWIKPFEVFGVNALLAYIIAELWAALLCYVIKIDNMYAYEWIYQTFFVPIQNGLDYLLEAIHYQTYPWLASEMFALFHVILFGLILWPMYKKKIYIKI